MQQQMGLKRACGVCHEKKIRCDLAENKPCSNCRLFNAECRPHQRQRKRKRPPQPLARPEEDGGQYQKLGPPLSGSNNCLEPPSDANIPLPPGHSNYPANTPTRDSVSAGAAYTPRSEGYLGRSEYFGLAAPKPQEIADRRPDHVRLTDEEIATLNVYRAFDLPPLPVQRALIESFETYCGPWMPVVEARQLRSPSSVSMLLLQSVFVAGSRVAAASHISASAETYYRRAKALFFSSYESNPMTKIAAACLLNWWNPVGPEQVSVDGSGFWLRVAVSLAHQIGLHREASGGSAVSYRRRLWWTLVARDVQISSAHGRPRAIDMADSDIPMPSAVDFPDLPGASLFTAYVKISMILGDTTQSRLRHQLSSPRAREMRNALYCWVSELPRSLRLHDYGQLNQYNLRTYSLHVPYFVTLAILYRSTAPPEVSAAISAITSAFLVGIFEEILARDEFQFLPPIFKFYVFVAGMGLIQARALLPCPLPAIEEQLDIVESSLASLSDRWSSAVGTMRSLQSLRKKMPAQAQLSTLIPLPSGHEAFPLFRHFGADLCRMWHLVEPTSVDSPPSQRNRQVEPEHRAGVQLDMGPATEALSPMPPYQEAIADGESVYSGDFWDWSLMGSSGTWLLDELPGGFLET